MLDDNIPQFIIKAPNNYHYDTQLPYFIDALEMAKDTIARWNDIREQQLAKNSKLDSLEAEVRKENSSE